jgi:hypothetical protein
LLQKIISDVTGSTAEGTELRRAVDESSALLDSLAAMVTEEEVSWKEGRKEKQVCLAQQQVMDVRYIVGLKTAWILYISVLNQVVELKLF